MKFTSYNIQKLWKYIKDGKIRGIVIYGNDHGLTKYRYNEIKELLQVSVRSYKYSDIVADDLTTILNTADLFCGKPIVKIYDAPSDASNNLKSSVNATMNNFLVLCGNNFSTNSTTVKWFEEQGYLASLGCYADNNDTMQLLHSKVKQLGKTITGDAAEYFSKTVYKDRDCCLNEINKLLAYCHDSQSIGISEVQQCIGTELDGSADLMCIYLARQQEEKYYHEISKLKSSNIPEIWMIKALIRFFIHLYTILLRGQDGVSINDAIKLIHPPIFFKYVQDLHWIVQTKTLQEVLHALYILYELELEYKTSYYGTNLPIQAFLRIHSRYDHEILLL